MREPGTRDHLGLVAHHNPAPSGRKPLRDPRPARCTTRSYGGAVVTVEGVVTARTKGLLAFSAEYSGWGQWKAWVDRDCCEPLGDVQ